GHLEAAGAIRVNETTFRGFARLFGAHAPVQAGEFLLPAGMSAAAVLHHLQFGRPVQRAVTVPEGMPSVLVHERLMRLPYLTGAIEVPVEGSVLPNTYNYRRGESRAAVLARMQNAMRRELDRLWRARRPGAAVVSPEAAIILASIVEKETGKPSERRLIAGVYSNRLRRGMPLQADPTVIYPVTRGRPLGRRILLSELRANNGYNTYASAGLPIGPIESGLLAEPAFPVRVVSEPGEEDGDYQHRDRHAHFRPGHGRTEAGEREHPHVHGDHAEQRQQQQELRPALEHEQADAAEGSA